MAEKFCLYNIFVCFGFVFVLDMFVCFCFVFVLALFAAIASI